MNWKLSTFLLGILLSASIYLPAQLPELQPENELATLTLPDAPDPQNQSTQDPNQSTKSPQGTKTASTPNAQVPESKQQPKRILGLMPNYRAVSAGAIPPPPTPSQAFGIATKNSFDYSSFVFVGITSLFAEGSNSHPKLGKGVPGYWAYYWRGFVDKTDGNYWVIWAYPTIFHQDERYFALGKGGFVKRTAYAASRILITPNYSGHNSFNASEILGRSTAQLISTAYYPSSDRTAGALAVRFGWAMGRDALTNVFREWWPDIATHVLHRHP